MKKLIILFLLFAGVLEAQQPLRTRRVDTDTLRGYTRATADVIVPAGDTLKIEGGLKATDNIPSGATGQFGWWIKSGSHINPFTTTDSVILKNLYIQYGDSIKQVFFQDANGQYEALYNGIGKYTVIINGRNTGTSRFTIYSNGPSQVTKYNLDSLGRISAFGGFITPLTIYPNGNLYPFVLYNADGTAWKVLIDSTGKALYFAGLPVEGLGIPAITAKVDSANQTGEIPNVDMTGTGNSGYYEISYYMHTTQAGTGGKLGLLLQWQDATLITYSVPDSLVLSDTNSFVQGHVNFYMAVIPTQEAFTYQTEIVGGSGDFKYRLAMVCKRMW